MLLVSLSVPSTHGLVKHMHLMDRIGHNLLFRGGSPEVNKVFSIENLKATLIQAANASNVELPQTYNLTVINLENIDTSILSGSDDGDNVITEFDFFLKNPNEGHFLFWKMTGEASHAANKVFDKNGTRAYLSSIYPTWGQDKLVERILMLREMMTKQMSIPKVIYFHCDCGCDRTGQTAGSYAMQYLNKTWDEVCEWNEKVAGRPQTCSTHRQMQWYCLYLSQTNKQLGDCLKLHLCTPDKLCI